LTSGGTKSKLVEGQCLSASSKDASTRGRSEAKSGHSALWHLKKTIVIGDCADNNDYFIIVGILGVRHNPRQ
jgi:hypothetical protein